MAVKMILVCDIGNTNINIGLFKSGRLVSKINLPTKEANKFKRYALKRINLAQLDAMIICSVVPAVLYTVKTSLIGIKQFPIYVLGENLSVPITNLYLKPKQVGQDRLVNAYAGVMLYGAPLIVVDFGTAITLDIISKKKEYLGGMIIPGLGVSLDVLSERTALLPKIKLARPKEFIGRDTKNSMLSGIVYGFSALIDELSLRIKDRMGKEAKVVATGGDSGLISKYCKGIDRLDTDLTLKGLYMVYRAVLSKKSSV